MYRNAPIHPFLRFIYLFLRVTSWVGISVFYRRRVVLGKENLHFDGPAIVVVNHPSTLMDVLNTCVHIRQECFFLANYGLFKHPVSRWFFSRLYCIPVKRREDVAEGEARNNDAAFEKSFQHLEKNGLLFIAAEGVSWMERWVRPFKTGTARIAFGAETRNQWQLGVKILPVGLSYSAPNLFRSEVIVNFGKPIDAAEWAQKEAASHEEAVEAFTQEIQTKVQALVLDTGNEAGQVFAEQLESLKKEAFPEGRSAYFEYRKKLLENNLGNQDLSAKTANYFASLKEAKISNEGLAQSAKPGQQASDLVVLLLGLPVFLLGLLFWFLPCYLPWLLAKKLNLYVGYDSNVKMLAGLFTFPLGLWALFTLAATGMGAAVWGWLAILAAAATGFWVEFYLDCWKRWRALGQVKNARAQNPLELDRLEKLRQELLQEIH